MKNKLFVIVVFGCMLASCGNLSKLGKLADDSPKFVQKNNFKIAYSKGATMDDAQKLLDYFDQIGWIDGTTIDMQIHKAGEGYNVKLIPNPGFERDEKKTEKFNELACEISKIAFNDQLVVIQMCDNEWNMKKTVQSSNCEEFEGVDFPSKMFGGSEVLYGDSISERELN